MQQDAAGNNEVQLSIVSTLGKRGRSSDPQGPPGKIQQMDTGSDMDTNEYSISDVEHTQPVRDEVYYMEDGSCIFLVQNTLFNVHRSILSKDSSSFSAMFSLPQGPPSSSPSEGSSDNNPIILHGDTPSEFRHFLWALYALPPELRIVTTPSADLSQLIDIARVSNKYAFKTLETWALDAIQVYVNRKPCPILSAIPPPASYTFPAQNASASAVEGTAANTDQLTRLIRLAQLCGHQALLDTMIDLLTQLMTSSLQYAYLAMTLADELDIRALKGAAYLEIMQKATVVTAVGVDLTKPTPGFGGLGASNTSTFSSTTPVRKEPRLLITPSQQLRLLSGYYRLTRIWESLRTTPPPFEHAPSCGATWHQHGCNQSWVEFWKDKTRGDVVLGKGLADVLGRLKVIQKDYDRLGSSTATYMHHDCRIAARRSIAECIRKIEEALPDLFGEGHGGDGDGC
ncbi:uncharacterized protein LACBIDRAFT_322584 [Laccaria bicolor S238N-H82]|uniref:Predicted protein n=1 Tax=Laccaria bicolor (strain S238N-H82 / ATCC MYA-4686) TaxID=486041 RepID=B0CWT9_LACBS|nr:uncharacterized protein LACBIDRAFT_322584 [Laccaria bicolor S238N-H82]EDR13128.1 predicted protein [Laccaria bicolor S238N-H82]|eukprot:XP_001875626.1 predicted protein [Laccaria bicolor S238N-H82]